MRIIVVESDTPELAEVARRTRGASNSDRFQAVFAAAQPDIQSRVFSPYAGETPDYSDAVGIVFTGSAVDWRVDDPKGAPITQAMERAFSSGLPVWGSCNGMQLAAVLLGGTCRAAPSGFEAGIARAIELTVAGEAHPMMAGRRHGFAAPCIHRDEVADLPPDAVLLACNAHSRVQAFAYEAHGISFWGVQYHPEYTAASMAAALSDRDGQDPGFISDLRAADTDPKAAERLGVHGGTFGMRNRANELFNWLAMVETRSDAVLI
ncbi:MAG: type 1 glutamine amidotransferase [Pseudomonadota bacterium]